MVLMKTTYAVQRQVLLAQVRQTLHNQSNVIDHLENKRAQKRLLHLLIIGSKSIDVDIALFCQIP